MSKSLMWIVIAVVVVAAVGGIWYANSTSLSPAAQPTTENGPAVPDQSGAQAAGQDATGAQSQALPSGSSDTDASLNADLDSIDSQMQSADSANASAQSFSDTPVQQTE